MRQPFKRTLIYLALAASSSSFINVQSTAYAAEQIQTATLRFDIAPGSLGQVLTRFSDQTGLRLIVASQLLTGHQSSGLTGQYKPQQALEQLLAGTGLVGVIVGEGSNAYIQVQAPVEDQSLQSMELDAVAVHSGYYEVADGPVQGYRATRSGTGTKTDTPLRDVPQSIQVVSRQVIEDQQITSLSDALTNVSSIQRSNSHGGTTESFVIRGFQNTTYAIDGVMTNSLAIRPEVLTDLSNLERIEVLKGPASVLYGRGNPGGLINLVSRKPSFTPELSLKTQVGAYDSQRVQINASGPFSDNLAGGIALAWQHKDGFRDTFDRASRRFFVAPSVRWYLGDNTKIDLGVEYSDLDSPYDRGLLAINGRVDSRSRIVLQDPWSRSETDKYAAWFRLEHQATDWLTLRQITRWDKSDKHMVSITTLGALRDDGTINRRATNYREQLNSLTVQFEGVAKFNTGSIKHTLLAGAEYVDGNRDNKSDRATLGYINIYNPIYSPEPKPADYSFSSHTEYNQYAYSFYLQDQIDLTERWKLLAGVRWDSVDQRNESLDRTGKRTALTQITPTKYSPRLGVVYQPSDWVSLYASFSKSFSPQTNRTRTGGILAPETGDQYEIGAKFDLIPDKLSATLAVFEITRENVAADDPTDTDYSVATGEQRVRGIELDVTGEIMAGWNVIGNISLLDAKVTKDTVIEEGNRLQGVPSVSGSLWSNYQIQTGSLQGLGFGAGIVFASGREGDIENTYDTGGYARVDASIFYNLNAKTRFSLNARNLLDRDYIENISSAGNYAVEPASVVATADFSF